MKVTGSIVTYNNGNIIYECIKSVLEQTQGVDFTLYVVDNGSTDRTLEIIKNNFDGQVKIIENGRNLGFGRGHNRVIEEAESDYHAVINPDITLAEDTIAVLCRYMEENSGVLMATPKILNEDGTEQYLPKYCPTIRYVMISKLKPFRYLRKRYTREEENFTKPVEVEFCTGCFFVARTALLKELKGFDPRYFMYCEDADLSRKVRRKGKIIFYPWACATHKWGRDNTRSFKGVFRFLSSLFKYFCKWGFQV
ncbi:MAG: glycosyltransferase family 2 protein [Alistipes sp.]|nr:glycosyltransferase family 2 protein [Alistipes sp.]